MGNSTSYTVNIKALFDASDAQTKIKNIQTTLNNLKLPDNLRSSFNSVFNELNKSLDDFQTKSRQGIKNKADATVINKSFDRVITGMEKYDQIVQKIKSQFGDQIDLNNWIKIDDGIKQKLEGIKKEIDDLQRQLNNITPDGLKKIEQVMSKLKTEKSKGKITEALDIFKGATDVKDIQRAIDLIEKAKKSYAGLASGEGKGSQTAKEIITQYQAIIDIIKDVEKETQNVQQKLDLKQDEKLQVSTQAAQELNNQLNNCGNAASQMTQSLKGSEQPMKDLVTSAGQFGSELEQVKSRIQYFLGLANAINLVKRAIRSSFTTIKELDKAMTETAVVTNYTIKDMWKQLPEYTKRANQLGVTTKEAYESATLYYQQGLNTEQAAALSTETLKMARIAGLDAADATDRMTNALRGFNMELNTAQAQRVDDVYSQLAAMSASNVDEISTAMTKVASLAHNANMEFETTAAFLAQIIESTRESAETAGTALKTVVARFSEVKKLYDKEELKGQDEEGQVIDVNKVSAALRTAGIDLNKYFLGEVGLDDIFIELASKWDSLTNIQQRYIATQAAGSRQQSRFIALMADYARTQELVSAAYNSNGAAEKQFEKTQDSMQSKLARLKNAWDEFAMGLANNAVLKGAVDTLTKILQIVNKLTGALGSGAGSFLKWAVAIKTFGVLKRSFGNGGFIDKAVTTVLKGSRIGQALISRGVTSGIDLNGNVVANSVEAQARKEGKTTIIPRTSLLSDIFNGNLKKKIQAFKEANAIPLPEDTVAWNLPGVKEAWAKGEDWKSLAQEQMKGVPKTLFGAFGTKFVKTGPGRKIAKTGLVKGLVGKGMAEGAAALTTALGGVAVAVGAVVAAYAAWSEFSLEGQLKQAKKYSEQLDKVATAAEQAKQQTKQVSEQYSEKTTAVQQAETVQERNKAIQERNDYLTDLVQQNTKYAQYLSSTFENGQLVLTLDEASIDALVKSTAEAANKAEQSNELAKAAAAGKQARIYEKEYQSSTVDLKNRAILENAGMNDEFWRDMTEEEISRYTRYQNLASQERAAEKAHAKAGFARMLDTSNLSDEMSEAVASAMAETFNSDAFFKSTRRQRRANWWSGEAKKEELKRKYRDLYGVEAETEDKDELASAIASAEIIKETYSELIDKVSDISKEKQGLKLLQIISGTYEDSLENIGTEISEFLKNEDIAKALMQMFDTDGEGLAKILNGYIEQIEKTRKEYTKNALKSLMSSGMRDTAALQKFSKLEIAQQKKVIKIGETLSDYGANFRNQVESAMINAMNEEGGIGADLDDFIGSLSDNIILTFQAIQEGTQNTKKEVAGLAQKLKEVGEEEGIFSKQNLVQFYLTSGEFSDLNEQVDKFIEENGKITSYNIQELAKESKSLAALLDTGTMSANGLAKAIQAFSKGNIAITDLNDNILEVFNNFENLTDIVSKAQSFIKNFDAGEDWGESFDFIDSAIQSMEALISSRELGNPQLQNYWKAIFTTTPTDLQDWEKGIEILKTLQQWGGGRFWTDVMGASLDEKTGVMTNMGAEGLTSVQYRKLMRERANAYAKAQGLPEFTEDFLNMQFQNMANHDYGVVKELAANDVRSIVEIYRDAFGEEKPTQADIQTIADGLGITPEQVLQYYNEKYKTTYTFDELAKTIKRNLSESFEDVINQNNDKTAEAILKEWGGGEDFSIDSLKVKVKEVVPEVKAGAVTADEWINQFIQEKGGTEGITLPVKYKVLKEENGVANFAEETVYVTVKNLDEYEEFAQKIQNDADNLNAAVLVGDLDAAKSSAETLKKTLTDIVGTNLNVNYTSIEDALKVAGDLQTSLSADASKTVTITEVYNTSGNNKVDREYPNNDQSGSTGAAGGIVSYASGARRIKPGVALTGEEGPELVWNKNGGYAYLVGKHGPEFANLVQGDQVFPADETEDIIKRGVTPSLAKGGKIIPSYYDGTIWTDANDEDKGKGSDSNKKDGEFKMDLDKYYNMVEDINELLRIRNLLETDYNQLLKTEGKTGKEIYDNLTRQLTLLRERQEITADLAEKRKQQIIDLVAENEELQKYAWWNNEDLTIEINWDLVNGITDKDEGSKVKDYLSKLEDFQSKYDDMIEQLEDIESAVQDISKRGKEQYNTLEERTRDALIKQIQDKIDELQEVDKAISDANQKLFDSISQTLELQRQTRDNTKTEEELADKEQRLAYLRQDSSNANQVEIARLEKELDESRENYTDTLIDQKISELQRQNEEAAQQRQEQIDLMQQSLDYQDKTGAFWDEVYRLISEGIDVTGNLIPNSNLVDVLKNNENWEGLSQQQRSDWADELIDTVAQAVGFLSISRQLETIGTKAGSSISFTNANGQTLTGTVDKDGNVVVKNKDGSTTTYKDVFQDYHGAYRTFEESGETKSAAKASSGSGATKASSGTKSTSEKGGNEKVNPSGHKIGDVWYTCKNNVTCVKHTWTKDGEVMYEQAHVLENLSGAPSLIKLTRCKNCKHTFTTPADIEGVDSPNVEESSSSPTINNLKFKEYLHNQAVSLYEPNISDTDDVIKTIQNVEESPTSPTIIASIKEPIKKRNFAYASGGLADFTGPAWLDGTRAHPELVLNARDTENFIQLRDVLANMHKANGQLGLNGGDNYYDITVNVDQMSSDYDVDRAIDRIKTRLYQDGAYRNVNTLSRLR